MNRLAELRLALFCCFCLVSALTLAFYFLPWRFVIPGYRFPYHGMPSLILGLIALCMGLMGTLRNWGVSKVKWPWFAAIVLVAVQLGLLIGFLQGPDVAVGRGETVAPWGEMPIEMQFDIKPLWGAYAAVIGSFTSLVLAVLSLLANRIFTESSDPPPSPVGREMESWFFWRRLGDRCRYTAEGFGVVEKSMRILERIACAFLIGWLQVVGVLTHSVLHHVLHAAPLALLLVVRPSPGRHFTGLLAGYLWVFMLAVATPMLHNALIRGYLFNFGQPYIWLAPVAATLAAIWAAANMALLRENPKWFAPCVLFGFVLTWLFAWVQPYVSRAIEYPLDRTLAGAYSWALILLLETAVVLAVPAWVAFRTSSGLQMNRAFIGWQVAYWVFFVAAMVIGLLPAIVRDR